ncbi:MAG TPA: hypothetical protein VFQ70_03625 [Candidatus Saccharimonadaceae bacterium]|nr:hypothetical protein [Candidatus Saccharimonadaceae bacterium]
MEHVPQSEAGAFQSGAVTSWEYETESPAMNVARIKVEGRYPAEGFTKNRLVDSIIYVISGSGILGAQDGSHVDLAPHDQLHLAIDDAYFFEGDLELLYCATPKWTPEQVGHVE